MPAPPAANDPEPTPLGGKGLLGCLGIVGLLVVAGFLLWPPAPKKSSLTPAQREELSRLVGNYEGMSAPQGGLGAAWVSGWTARLSLNESNQLKCQCILTLYRKPSMINEIFREVVDVQYQDSVKAGQIRIAISGSNKERWSLYVESPVLKSGKAIASVLLHDNEFGECMLLRQ